MLLPIHILEKYWGYTAFRYPQQEIILSVLDGKDTLALLPTGGGKSVCFQVPAILQDGICIVVSPLIALMKDQVYQLSKRGIKASAIFSGLSYNEIDKILDNAVFGMYKLLYVSPERLKTELFIERFKQMKVNLIAVDEAHCISQWGYDFRPPYLEIAEIRQYHPDIPVLALTATATQKVQDDIIEKLHFRDSNIFRKSFVRDNLSFVVRHELAKLPKLVEVIKKLKGSGIVYVRNRKQTKEIAEYLKKNKLNADFYHAGLSTDERNAKQDNWIKNKTQVIVCTNAFGMGIDKADVRFVIHFDIPETLEAYYQEAGRAGRDGKKSYAMLLYEQKDIDNLLQKLEQKYPDEQTIKMVYNAVCNHLEVAIENGAMHTYFFDLLYFCKLFKLNAALVYNALKILEQQNYMQLSEGVELASRIIFRVDKSEVYRFEVAHSVYSPLIKSLLRTYGGILDHYSKISEEQLARLIGQPKEVVVKQLLYLHKQKLLTYIPSSDKPTITLLTERLHENNLLIDSRFIQLRKEVQEVQLKAMLNYTEQDKVCRQVVVCAYFDEKEVPPCGRCDVCLEQKNKLDADKNFESIKSDILGKTKNNFIPIEKIIPENAFYKKEQYKKVIRFMLDERMLMMNEQNEIKAV